MVCNIKELIDNKELKLRIYIIKGIDKNYYIKEEKLYEY